MQVPAQTAEAFPMTTVFAKPKPVNLSAHQIDDVASAFSEKILFSGNMTLEQLVSKMGGTIHLCGFWDDRNASQGSIEILAINNFSIYIADHTARETNRFTM